MRLPQPAPAAGHTRKSQGSVVDASLSLGSNGRALFSTSPGETEAKAAHGPIHPEQATVGRLRGEAALPSGTLVDASASCPQVTLVSRAAAERPRRQRRAARRVHSESHVADCDCGAAHSSGRNGSISHRPLICIHNVQKKLRT